MLRRSVPEAPVLCCTGGKVGLIDYGQSKQLPDDARIAFAKLIVAMDQEDKQVGLETPACWSVFIGFVSG